MLKEKAQKSLGSRSLIFLAGETHFYKYGLNLYAPDGKALFYEYDKVQGVYDMKKWTMVNQRFASEGWVYPKRNEDQQKCGKKKVIKWIIQNYRHLLMIEQQMRLFI